MAPKSKSTAIVPVSNEVTVKLPTNAVEVSHLQKAAEDQAPIILDLRVEDADDYTIADDLLSDLARRKDEIVAMRKSATGPLYTVIKTVESWFKPYITVLDGGISHLKGQLSAYNVAEAKRLEASRQAATAAAEARDSAALLAAVSEPAPAPVGRATTTWFWRVDRVIREMLRDEDLIPDMAKFEAAAKAAGSGEQPPVIPGVVFVRDARMGARR